MASERHERHTAVARTRSTTPSQPNTSHVHSAGSSPNDSDGDVFCFFATGCIVSLLER
jgi:hypothetical protein